MKYLRYKKYHFVKNRLNIFNIIYQNYSITFKKNYIFIIFIKKNILI
jgi:hypothetical protein